MKFRLTILDKLTGRVLDTRVLSGVTEWNAKMRVAAILPHFAEDMGYDVTSLRGDLTLLAPTPTAIPAPFYAAFNPA